MLKKMNKTIILLLIITLTSCQFSAKVNNEEYEKEKAEVVASKFHKNYNSQDFQQNVEIFASPTIDENGKEKLVKLQEDIYKERGEIINRQIHKWSTVRSADQSWEASLIFLIDYENSKGVQQMDFIKEDGIIKLLVFNVN